MIKRDHIPLFPIILPVFLAQFSSPFSNWPATVVLFCSIVSFSLAILFHAKKRKASTSLFDSAFVLALFLSIFLLMGYRSGIDSPQNVDFDRVSAYKVIKVFGLKPGSSWRRHVIQPRFDYQQNANSFKTVLMIKGGEGQLKRGDLIALKSTPKEIGSKKNADFDFKQYYLQQGIKYQCFAEANCVEVLGRSTSWNLLTWAENSQQKLVAEIKIKYGDTELAHVLQAMILGDRSELSQEFRSQYAALGVVHVLAVSGLHVGLIFVAINALLKVFNRPKWRGLYFVTIIVSIWVYCCLTGLSPSTVRAATMLSVFLIGRWLQRRSKGLNTLFFTFVLMLFWSPQVVNNLGFQLSFLALLGILLFAKPIRNTIEARTKVANWILNGLSVSIAAQLVTFPLIAHHFGIHSNLFLISNLIILPLFVAMLYTAFIHLILGFLGLDIVMLDRVVDLEFLLINVFGDALIVLPNSVTHFTAFGQFEMGMIYLAITLIVLAFFSRKAPILFLGISLFWITVQTAI